MEQEIQELAEKLTQMQAQKVEFENTAKELLPIVNALLVNIDHPSVFNYLQYNIRLNKASQFLRTTLYSKLSL